MIEDEVTLMIMLYRHIVVKAKTCHKQKKTSLLRFRQRNDDVNLLHLMTAVSQSHLLRWTR